MSGRFTNHGKAFKVLSLVLAFVLVIGASVAGTLAWLTAQTPTVTNTFTSAELFANPENDFTLWEHEAKDDDGDGVYTLNSSNEVTSNSYRILPGVNIPKNPTVDVVGLEEHAYLYIKVTSTLPEGLTYSIDSSNWTVLSGYDGVYVYSGPNAESNIVKATNSAPKTFEATILTDNQIVVADNYSGTSDDITLSFNAYMVQATGNGADAAEAWTNTFGAENP